METEHPVWIRLINKPGKAPKPAPTPSPTTPPTSGIRPGEENAGKSSFSSFTCYNLALPEAENNLHVLYMTIDDSVPELFPKFVAMAGRHRTLAIVTGKQIGRAHV